MQRMGVPGSGTGAVFVRGVALFKVRVEAFITGMYVEYWPKFMKETVGRDVTTIGGN
jgi:hypothetical protein